MKLSGRTFVVSGGSSGLGRACVFSICRAGGNVAILDLNEELDDVFAKELSTSAKLFVCDVSDTDSIEAAVTSTLSWIKETKKPLGGIISAAGVGNPSLTLDRNLEPVSLSHLDFVIGINLRGTLDLVRQVLPHLAAGPPDGPDDEKGVVVMVSSVAAFDGQMGQVAYAATKGAVASMTLPMARDLSRHHIRVVTIAPGFFDTGMTAMMNPKARKGIENTLEFPKRAGTPEEFAALVREAISNGMLNGTVLRLDGGARLPSKI